MGLPFRESFSPQVFEGQPGSKQEKMFCVGWSSGILSVHIPLLPGSAWSFLLSTLLQGCICRAHGGQVLPWMEDKGLSSAPDA